jgi:iron complex transport system ATP-binding protein
MNEFILESRALSIGYFEKKQPKIIGQNINICLKKASLVALVGQNGVGKSTLLRTLSGIQKPVGGELFFNSKSYRQYNIKDLAQYRSVLLTDKIPLNNLNVLEIISQGRQPYTHWFGKISKQDEVCIRKAIESTQIASLVNRKAYEISDGQLQKVLLARALAQDTALIFLDEPSNHLDIGNKLVLIKLLKDLTIQTQKTILFSTHDIDMAIQIADQMIVMTDNETLQDTPCNLIEQGVFNQLFQQNDIAFDVLKGKYVFK